MAAPQSTDALAGVRVLELTTTLAGPFCGRLLSDFGAEVIKVEPSHGDDLRTMGKRAEGVSLYAASVLRNKALIAVNLRETAGQEVIRRLAAQCDIVVENFRPGLLERLNLGYEALAKDNPKLVMVRISGYGQTGPYSGRPGYGVISEAVAGMRHLTGQPEEMPPRIAVSLTDYIAATYGAFGAMVALHHAQRTGVGQVVDTALYEGAFSFTEPYVPAYDKLGVVQNRTGHALPNSSPNNLYVAADGQPILICAPTNSIFRRLARLMGREELADDPRFHTPRERQTRNDELDAIIGAWCGRFPLAELEPMLHGADIPASRVFTMADIFTDPHYRARGMLAEVPDEALGAVTLAGPVPKLSVTPGRVRWSGRQVGRDTQAVLTNVAGFSAEEVERLEAQGIVAFRQSESAGGGK